MYYKFRDDIDYYEDAARLLEHTRARGIVPNIPREVSFKDGQKISKGLELPILMELDTRAGNDLRLIMGVMFLVMRDDLVKELWKAGVDNLDAYETVIKNPFTSEDILNYKTVNIIGAIFTADLIKSDYHASDTPEQPVIDTIFRDLVIDESRTGGMLMFRMAESISTILVHEKVKNHLEGKFPSLKFIPVKNSGS